MKKLSGVLLTLLGAAGFAAALGFMYVGMRHVMVADGGSCASGGPYLVAHQCSGSDVAKIMGGIFGMLFAGFVLAVGVAMLKGPVTAVALAMWSALFGVLGINFLSLGFNPPDTHSSGASWIICGVVFELMALGGLVPLVMMTASWIRSDRSVVGGDPTIHPI